MKIIEGQPYTVYALLCPKTKNVRYVGYTQKSLEERLYYHYHDMIRGFKTYKTNWLKSLTERAIIVPIESGIPTLEMAVEKEIKWISFYSKLTNSTTGGEISKAVLPGVRKKMSDSQKRNTSQYGYINPMLGKERKDLADRNKAKIWSDEQRVGKSLVMADKYNTPEYRKLFVESQKTRKPVLQLTMSGEIVKEFPSTARVKTDGFGSKEVQYCCLGKHSQHKGFKWAYA